MARINIVRPRDKWALQRIAESWQIPDSKVSDVPDPDADVNLWVNYVLFKTVGKFQKNRCDVGYFTHYEKSGPFGPLFYQVAKHMDWCIAMCEHTASHLPPDKTTVIHSSPHTQFRKSNIVLGVCGRDCCRKHRGYRRKRVELIPELQKIPGIEVRYTGGKLRFEQLPDWYRSMDYLLVLAALEGGLLPVLEGLAMGKPVIAPDVGWCWDYPVLRYAGFDELLSIVGRLVVPGVEHESKQIMDVIERVCQ